MSKYVSDSRITKADNDGISDIFPVKDQTERIA